MTCRTGCPTQDHESYGQCLREANVSVATVSLTAFAHGRFTQKQHDRNIAAYREARRQGVQPEGTRRHQVESALRAAEKAT